MAGQAVTLVHRHDDAGRCDMPGQLIQQCIRSRRDDLNLLGGQTLLLNTLAGGGFVLFAALPSKTTNAMPGVCWYGWGCWNTACQSG